MIWLRIQIQEAAPIIGSDKATEYLTQIDPGATAQIPEGFTEQKIQADVKAALIGKLGLDPNVGSLNEHMIPLILPLEQRHGWSWISIGTTSEKVRLLILCKQWKQLLLMSRNEIYTAKDGSTFGTVPAAKNDTTKTFFPSFVRNQGNLLGQTNWRPDQDEQELTRRIEAHTGSSENTSQ